jgi:hypothetical protein
LAQSSKKFEFNLVPTLKSLVERMNYIVCIESIHYKALILAIEVSRLGHEKTSFAELTCDQIFISSLFEEKWLHDGLSFVCHVKEKVPS